MGGSILQTALPNFDFEAFKREAHKSAAEMSLIMFAFDPEQNMQACLHDLKLVLHDTPEDTLKQQLEGKKAKFAVKEDHGRIPCDSLEDISQKVMHAVEEKTETTEKTKSPKNDITSEHGSP